jgi:nitrite reductase/ring-hydroxylating ferredoxin subunit
MVLRSKIVIFLILLFSGISLISCKKNKNDVIPDVTVNFYIDLSDPEFFNLNAIGNADTVSSATNNLGLYAAGYDDNGIIVYRATLDEFYAYDRTCPHDYVLNGSSVKVNVDFTIAVCPRCSTNYALSAFGTPISGPGKYPLKNYKTYFDGQSVHVWNNY